MLNSGVSEPRDLSPRLHFPPIRRDKPGGSLLSLRLSDKEVAPLFSKWPIRVKLLIGLGLLVVMVAILASSGLYTHLCLSQPGEEPELAGERVAAGRRGQQPREQAADPLSELRGLRAGPVRRRPRRPGAAAGPPGPRAVPRRAGRGGRGGGRHIASRWSRPCGPTSAMADNQPERDAVRKIEVALRTHSRDRKRSQLDLQRGAGGPHGRRVGWAARAGGGIAQPAARQAERVRRRGPRPVSHLARGPVDHQRDGGVAVRPVRAAVLSLDFPAAADARFGGRARWRGETSPIASAWTPATRSPSWPRP